MSLAGRRNVVYDATEMGPGSGSGGSGGGGSGGCDGMAEVAGGSPSVRRCAAAVVRI